MKILSIELWRIFIARVILHQLFDIFQILKDVSVLEKVDFRPWDFFTGGMKNSGNLVTESSDRVVQRS